MDDECRHVYGPYMPGWFFDAQGDLRREYHCRICGHVDLFGPGEYPNAHLGDAG